MTDLYPGTGKCAVETAQYIVMAPVFKPGAQDDQGIYLEDRGTQEVTQVDSRGPFCLLDPTSKVTREWLSFASSPARNGFECQKSSLDVSRPPL